MQGETILNSQPILKRFIFTFCFCLCVWPLGVWHVCVYVSGGREDVWASEVGATGGWGPPAVCSGLSRTFSQPLNQLLHEFLLIYLKHDYLNLTMCWWCNIKPHLLEILCLLSLIYVLVRKSDFMEVWKLFCLSTFPSFLEPSVLPLRHHGNHQSWSSAKDLVLPGNRKVICLLSRTWVGGARVLLMLCISLIQDSIEDIFKFTTSSRRVHTKTLFNLIF